MKAAQSEIQKRIIAKVADDITINSNDDEVVIDAVKYFKTQGRFFSREIE